MTQTCSNCRHFQPADRVFGNCIWPGVTPVWVSYYSTAMLAKEGEDCKAWQEKTETGAATVCASCQREYSGRLNCPRCGKARI